MEATVTAVDHPPLSARPPGPVLHVLTHSAMEAWGRCEIEYRLAYRDRLAPTAYPAALAVGSGVHAGVEALQMGLPLPEAWRSAAVALARFLDRARAGLDENAVAGLELQAEHDMARVRAMLTAWAERNILPAADGAGSVDRDLDIVATEQVLEAPLVNPLTGRPSRSFRLAGKLDAIARRRGSGAEGLYIVEMKTTGEELDSFAEAMTVSAQPAVYQVLAESNLGHAYGPVAGTVLDIIRKPTIRPKKDESPAEFEERALAAYRAEPEKFVRRVTLPVDHQLRREVMVNAWRIADGIRRAERFGYVTKRGPACRGAYGPCRYRPLCWHGDATGFALKQAAHEELADGA